MTRWRSGSGGITVFNIYCRRYVGGFVVGRFIFRRAGIWEEGERVVLKIARWGRGVRCVSVFDVYSVGWLRGF